MLTYSGGFQSGILPLKDNELIYANEQPDYDYPQEAVVKEEPE